MFTFARSLAFIIAIQLNLYVCLKIYAGHYSMILPLLWLSSLFLLLLAANSINIFKLINRSAPIHTLRLNPSLIITSLVLLLPIMVTLANIGPKRIHGDGMITAYFSAHYDLLNNNFFAEVPSTRHEWVSQFPTPFFVLQKIFLLAFGESLLTVKLSVIPYVLITALSLYLTVRELFREQMAWLAVFLAAFLPLRVYLDTLAVHFISSTAVFMIFFYLLVLNWRAVSIFRSALLGILTGLCYLFYLSSYIALPLLLITAHLHLLKQRNSRIWLYYAFSILAFLLTLGPFLTYAFKFNNYFPQRFSQVELTTGEWSTATSRIQQGETRFTILAESLSLTVRSFYQAGIGGTGGYDFGHLALLEPLSLTLFLAGLMSGLYMVIKQRQLEILLIFLVIALSFGAMLLSMMPPGFHRFSLALPFLAIIMALPFGLILRLEKASASARYILVAVLLVAYVFQSNSYLQKATHNERYNQDLRLADFIRQNLPTDKIYIAAFPQFALEKIWYFIDLSKTASIITDYHTNLLREFNPSEKYVYVILFPGSLNEKFKQADPRGRLIEFSKDYSLFVRL